MPLLQCALLYLSSAFLPKMLMGKGRSWGSPRVGLQAQGLIHSSLTHTLGLTGATALSPQSHTGRSLSRQGRGCACPDSQAPALTTDAVVGDTRGLRCSWLVQRAAASWGEVLSSQPRSLLRWGERSALNGGAVSVQVWPLLPLGAIPKHPEGWYHLRAASLGSEGTQTQQKSNAVFLFRGHCEIRVIFLKCCVVPLPGPATRPL